MAAWIGNTERVAQNHYLQVTDAHFAKAVAGTDTSADQAAQNPAQSGAVTAGKGKEATTEQNKNRSALPSDSDASRYLHGAEVAATGLEPVTRGL